MIWTARPYSLTGIGQDMKIDNVSTANSAIIFVSLFKTHGLEQWHYPTPENVTARKP
jgi:hypothetical protein